LQVALKSHISIQEQSIEYWIQSSLFIAIYITEVIKWSVCSVQCVSESQYK